MKKEYEVLFTPCKIGNVEIKNRFVVEPMAGTSMLNWNFMMGYDKSVHDMWVQRAKDGVGLIIPGGCSLYSMPFHRPLAEHPDKFKGIQEFMDELHSYGTKVFFQLATGFGRNCLMMPAIKQYKKVLRPVVDIDTWHAAPDEGLPNRWMPEVKTPQMKKEQINDLVENFGKVALLCKQNGVDGIEIHAVHEGYILDQFSTAYTNHRTDEYGGSLENRLRFACDIVKEIKKTCGNDYPVSIRYSVESRARSFGHGILPQDTVNKEIGRDLEESKEAVRILSEAGYDLINADNGTYDSWYYAHPPVYMPLNCNLNNAMAIKPYTDKPVACAGRMQLDEAAAAISEGKLDFMGVGRQILTEPEYLTKIREDRLDDIRPCISCHVGCMPIGLWKDSGIVMGSLNTGICALNPTTKNEKKYVVKEAKHKKHIAVIGGGIAGMEFALQAEKRGHTVDLYEKSSQLGGMFIPAAVFSFKEKDRDLIDFYRRQIERSSVNVHLNTEVKDLKSLKADDIVIATGALKTKMIPMDTDKAVSAVEFLNGGLKVDGEEVIIIGGGLTGCEIAYELALQGKKPRIVEMQDDILKVKGSSMANTSFLRDAFELYNVPVHVGAKTRGLDENGNLLIDLEDGRRIAAPFDKLVISIGYQQGIPFELGKYHPHVHVIGDADHVANLMNAIWSANNLIIKKFQ